MAVGPRSIGVSGLCLALGVVAPAQAQHVTMCALQETPPEDVEHIVSVELGRSVPVTLLGQCADGTAQIQVLPDQAGSTPVQIEVSLADVVLEARARFVGMVIAELIRADAAHENLANSRLVDPPPDDHETTGQQAQEEATVDRAAVLSNPRVPPPETGMFSQEALEASGLQAEGSAVPPAFVDTDEGPRSDPVRLQIGLGGRMFFHDALTPVIGLRAGLLWRRFSFYVEAFGANYPFAGEIWAFQLTAGFGYRLAHHEGDSVRVSWFVRGELGLGLSTANEINEFVRQTEFAPILAGITDLALLFRTSANVDLGVIITAGLQQGFTVLDRHGPELAAQPILAFHGVFAGLQLAAQVTL